MSAQRAPETVGQEVGGLVWGSLSGEGGSGWRCTEPVGAKRCFNFQSYLGKAGNLQAPIQPTLHASGFILVSSASYTCFCSLKQTTIVKHKGLAPNRLQSQVRCPPPVLQSRALSLGVLHPGLRSRPMGPEGGAQKHHF